jgi:hypothetical protein
MSPVEGIEAEARDCESILFDLVRSHRRATRTVSDRKGVLESKCCCKPSNNFPAVPCGCKKVLYETMLSYSVLTPAGAYSLT